MKLYFWRGSVANFGDELNTWLLPKVFPNFFDNEPDPLFLGIGSVLFDYHPADCRKIVFGSGYGGYTALPKFDDLWTFYCVRGPKTAKACGLGLDKVAGDTAILVSRFRPPAPSSTIPCSFMPHWESLERGNWEIACKLAGIHFLDPRAPVEKILTEIASSELVITEAMHGAIVSDALRVPWIALRPFDTLHRFKWFDWASPLEIDLSFARPWPSSVKEAWMVLRGGPGVKIDGLRQTALGSVINAADRSFASIAADWLRWAAKRKPFLSRDVALERAADRLQNAALKILKDFR